MVIHQQDHITNTNQIKVEGKLGESVGKFKYLRSVISANGNVNDDIIMKIGKTAANLNLNEKNLANYIDFY